MFGMIGSFLGVGRIFSFAEAVVRFFTSAAGVVVLVIVIAWFAHHKGRTAERRLCNAEVVAAENAELKRRLVATERVAATNRKLAEEHEAARAALAKEVESYESTADAKCVVSDTVRDRVQRIRKAK